MEVDIWWCRWNRQRTPLGEGAMAPDIAHPAHHFRTFAFHENSFSDKQLKNLQVADNAERLQENSSIYGDISNNEYRA
jgi:hypothetical protein